MWRRRPRRRRVEAYFYDGRQVATPRKERERERERERVLLVLWGKWRPGDRRKNRGISGAPAVAVATGRNRPRAGSTSAPPTGYLVMLLAIDPGLDSGWALFAPDRSLLACGLGTPKTGGVTEAIIEHPFIYPGGRTKSPNDIVKLAINAGEWSGRLRDRGVKVRFVYPRDWKGTIAAEICCNRALAALSDAEAAKYAHAVASVAKSKHHNVLDAIGLGLFAVGRWAR